MYLPCQLSQKLARMAHLLMFTSILLIYGIKVNKIGLIKSWTSHSLGLKIESNGGHLAFSGFFQNFKFSLCHQVLNIYAKFRLPFN